MQVNFGLCIIVLFRLTYPERGFSWSTEMKNTIKNLKIFFGFVIQRPPRYFVFVVTTVIASLLFFTLPYFYKLFTDNLLDGDIQALYINLALLMLVRVGAMIFKNISFFLGDRGLIDGSALARRTIFKHVQDLDFVVDEQYIASKARQ